MCTGIKLIAENNSIVYGRTLEFAQEINSEIIFVPRNYNFIGISPDQKNGLEWKTKYAAIGTNASEVNTIIDGINETGLAGGLFYFPEYAQYQETSKNDSSISI